MSTENVTLLARPTSAVAVPVPVVGRHPASSISKRVFDVVVASLALILLTPVLLLLAAAVYISSPGKVTFRQRRVGINGEAFKMVKFRSMVVDAERRLRTDHHLRELYLTNDFKIPAELDTRITKIGRFIRATSLDELPQLWNVVKGDMSLVGPRPVERAQLDTAGELSMVYESVRPGVTGPWQAGGRSTISYAERVQIESDYVADWSFWGDLVIILKTVPAVLRRHGAH